MSKPCFSLILSAMLIGSLYFLPACSGGGGGGDGSSSCNNQTGAGWVTIDQAATATDSAFIRLTGTAFISPTWSGCCSGSASDTGVTITWSNPASGDSGIASHAVGICYFFLSFPYLCDHTWGATVPLAMGNNTITITASDPGTSSGSSCITAARTLDLSPPLVSSVSPPDGALNALPSTSVSADFSEVMLSTSITPSTFTLAGPGNAPIAGTVSTTQLFSSNQLFITRAAFQPLAALDVFATYTATIDGSVKDYAGNNSMGQAYSWTFTPGVPISGHITYYDGSNYGGVTVRVVEIASGAISFVYTRYDTGNYSFVATRSGTYTITPFDSTCGSCIFSPTSRSVTVTNAPVSGQDFTVN